MVCREVGSKKDDIAPDMNLTTWKEGCFVIVGNADVFGIGQVRCQFILIYLLESSIALFSYKEVVFTTIRSVAYAPFNYPFCLRTRKSCDDTSTGMVMVYSEFLRS